MLPNLYGDIITDEAAEFQGGVGTAGSGNIGKRYAMFEAIHGSAPRMVKEGRAQYADPCSMLRASVMLLSHIGYQAQADKLDRRAGQMHVHGKGAHRHGPRHRLHLHRVRRLRDAHHRDPLIYDEKKLVKTMAAQNQNKVSLPGHQAAAEILPLYFGHAQQRHREGVFQ